MASPYNPADIEQKWQKNWAEMGLDQTPEDSSLPKFYALSMFPYPSGSLHMGHVRNYTITDVIARVKRMQGYRVLHPMGWDAFGLPAENAAIDRGIPPAEWTNQNMLQMKQQLQQLGLSIDWDREVATCSPDYYRWTQWLFLQFYEAGLAYQKEAAVNWDPIDQTVLANEQVDSEGKSWRSGAKVERKLLRQWFLKITDYAEQLLNDLDKLSGWPERVKTMQANWIGKSVGAYLEFPIKDSTEKIAVFTTRPDTVYGVTYLVLAPEHPLTLQVTTSDRVSAVEAFIKEVASESEIERTAEDKPKKGVLTGGVAINPFNEEEIPILIANYVLYEYGTGAVMGVPAHDVRDFKFAKENNLPIKVVILPDDADNADICLLSAYTDTGTLVNSDRFIGMDSPKAKSAIIKYAENQGYGKARIQYRLRDWLISRQRYWGCPIPVIHCPSCGTVPVPDADLPVKLPENVQFSSRGGSPLAKLESWVNVACPSCGEPAKRETDTMDTFIDSSWYFLRYTDAKNPQEAFNLAKVNGWMGVDQYVGGIEHAILHLLYSRFFTKVLRDRGLVNVDEPFEKLLTQGMVQAETKKTKKTGKYSNEYFASEIPRTTPIYLLKNPKTGKYVEQADWFYSTPTKPIIIGADETGQIGGMYYFDPDTGDNLERVQDENGNTYKNPKTGRYVDQPDTFECTPVSLIPIDGDDIELIPSDGGMYYCYDLDTGEALQSFHEKMSKSKYNGVDPQKVLGAYGADTARMFILFKAPPEKDLEWNDADVKGQFSFLNRVWRLVTEYIEKQGQKSSTINSAKLQNLNSKAEKDLHRAVHHAIKEIAEDLDGDYQFNTAISELMKLNNALNSANCLQSPAYQEAIEALLILLAPFAPHISEELWHQLGHNDSVHQQNWLTYDLQALVVDEITLVIQVMGKTKGTIQVPSAATKEDLENYARNSEIFQKFLQGKEIKKVIVVPGKLVNFVAS